MTNKPISEVIAEIKEAAESSTALNLDSAQLVRDEGGCYECPVCGGDGYVDAESDYCNIDGAPIGVQFYGIGEEFGLAEKYFRAASPANIKRLIVHIAALEQQNVMFKTALSQTNRVIADLEQQLAAVRADKRRMDWLVSHYVEVRTPLYYGSAELFVAQTTSDETDAEHDPIITQILDKHAQRITALPPGRFSAKRWLSYYVRVVDAETRS
ncbi:hypothetical protein AAGW04_07070 [Pectobacterium aroidearum]|uniref:hypothetical protein n=1 Tax=Pectobacterium aroidearum TaxID=1201031 RepID=UPI0031584348